VNRWLDHLGAQNLNQIHKNEFIDDLSNLKGFAKVLQSAIIGKANSVMDKLALLDLKLKEQKLLTQEIDGIRQHPGNINSNLGDNLPWKERLEEIVDNSASVHSEFDVALYGMCEVIKRINFYVKNMQKAYIAPSTIRQSAPETKYYPHDQIVHENNVAFHNLGPKVGQYNEKDPLHNGDVHLPGSKVREDVHRPESGLYNHKEKKHPHHKWVRRADHHLVNQIKKHIFPEIKKTLSQHVRNTVTSTNVPESHALHADSHSAAVPHVGHSETPQSILQKMAEEEARLENITLDKAEKIVQNELNNTINKKAKNFAKKTALKVAQEPKVHNAKILLKDALEQHRHGKISQQKFHKFIKHYKKVVKTTMHKTITTIQTKINNKLNDPNHSVLNRPALGKASAKGIVKNGLLKVLNELKVQKIVNATKKAVNDKYLRKAGLLEHHNKDKRNHLQSGIKSASINLHRVGPVHSSPQQIINDLNKDSLNVKNKNHYPGHLTGIPRHHKKQVTSSKQENPKVQQARQLVVDTVRASIAAENAAKEAQVLAQKVELEASKRPDNPIIKQAKKISDRNARVATNNAKKANLAVFEAKSEIKAVSQGKVNPSQAYEHIKQLKEVAKKAQRNAELAPKMSQAVKNKVTQTVKQIKQQPHLNKKEINTAVKLIKKVVNSALKAENAAQEARKLAQRAQQISAKNPHNQVIREATKIAIKNARISQKQAQIAADAVRKTKEEAKLFKSGREGVPQVFHELKKLSHQAQTAMRKAEAAPKKIVKLASQIPLRSF
jgi:hypothetical protein